MNKLLNFNMPSISKGGMLGVLSSDSCSEETYIDLPDETLIGRTLGQTRKGMGFRPDSGHVLYDKKIKSVTVKLDNDSGSPTETIYVRVRNSSGAIVDTFGSLDASSLDSTPTEYTFNEKSITLSDGYFLTIEYDEDDPAISVRVYRTGTNNYVDNASTLVSASDITSWATYYDYDYFWAFMKVVYCS